MPVYLGSDKVGITKELGNDMLQWKCDNAQSLYYEFRGYKGDNLDILQGLDTSKVKDFRYCFENCENITSLAEFDVSSANTLEAMFSYCKKLKEIKFKNMNKINNVWTLYNTFSQCESLTNVEGLDSSQVTNMTLAFSGCKILETPPTLNTSKTTNMNGTFQNCSALKRVDNLDTSSVTNLSYTFYNCSNLETLENIDCIKATNLNYIINSCKKIANLKLKNIKVNLIIGQYSSWGNLLSLDSLINTFKELWDYSSETTTRKLTLSQPSKNLITNVYVKLVDVTDEMLAQDQYAANKKPCVVCESTDEGAMTLTEYATSKNWAIA